MISILLTINGNLSFSSQGYDDVGSSIQVGISLTPRYHSLTFNESLSSKVEKEVGIDWTTRVIGFAHLKGRITKLEWERIQDRVETDPSCPVSNEILLSGNSVEELKANILQYCQKYAAWVKANFGISLEPSKEIEQIVGAKIDLFQTLPRLENICNENKIPAETKVEHTPYLPTIKKPSLVDIRKAVYNMLSCAFDENQATFSAGFQVFAFIGKICRINSQNAQLELTSAIQSACGIMREKTHDYYLRATSQQIERMCQVIHEYEEKHPGLLPIVQNTGCRLYTASPTTGICPPIYIPLDSDGKPMLDRQKLLAASSRQFKAAQGVTNANVASRANLGAGAS